MAAAGKNTIRAGRVGADLPREKMAGFPASEVSPEKAVAKRAFPLLLICDEADVVLPCRHAEMIQRAARGTKELWRVPGAMHTGALGTASEEFRRRVIQFFDQQKEAAGANRDIQKDTNTLLPKRSFGETFVFGVISYTITIDMFQSGIFCAKGGGDGRERNASQKGENQNGKQDVPFCEMPAKLMGLFARPAKIPEDPRIEKRLRSAGRRRK
jgi:hypothetical protein